MDTRYWGPSGWQLFHAVAASVSNRPTKIQQSYILRFYGSIPHILPCKFCRASSAEYISALGLPDATTRSKLEQWVFNLHEKVNVKLRKQEKEGEITGVTVAETPSLASVRLQYATLVRDAQRFIGMDFLSAVAHNSLENSDEKKEQAYVDFFDSLVKLYPVPAMRAKMDKHFCAHPFPHTMGLVFRWFYGLMSASGAEDIPTRQSLSATCNHYRSRCMQSTYRGKTCRRVVHGNTTMRVKRRDPSVVAKFVKERLA